MTEYGHKYSFSSRVSNVFGKATLKAVKSEMTKNLGLSVLISTLETIQEQKEKLTEIDVINESLLPFVDIVKEKLPMHSLSFSDLRKKCLERAQGGQIKGTMLIAPRFFPYETETATERNTEELGSLLTIASQCYESWCIFLSLDEVISVFETIRSSREHDLLIGPVTGQKPEVFAAVKSSSAQLNFSSPYEIVGAIGWFNLIIRPFRVDDNLCFDCSRVHEVLRSSSKLYN